MKEPLRYAIARFVLPLLFLVFICGVWANIGGFITLWVPLSLFVLGAHFVAGGLAVLSSGLLLCMPKGPS